MIHDISLRVPHHLSKQVAEAHGRVDIAIQLHAYTTRCFHPFGTRRATSLPHASGPTENLVQTTCHK